MVQRPTKHHSEDNFEAASPSVALATIDRAYVPPPLQGRGEGMGHHVLTPL